VERGAHGSLHDGPSDDRGFCGGDSLERLGDVVLQTLLVPSVDPSTDQIVIERACGLLGIAHRVGSLEIGLALLVSDVLVR